MFFLLLKIGFARRKYYCYKNGYYATHRYKVQNDDDEGVRWILLALGLGPCSGRGLVLKKPQGKGCGGNSVDEGLVASLGSVEWHLSPPTDRAMPFAVTQSDG